MTDFIAVPAITIIIMLLAQLYKSFVPEPQWKHIPVLCGLWGMILGIVAYVFIPGFVPAENVMVAAAIGIVSGFAATGVNQVYKQESSGNTWRRI